MFDEYCLLDDWNIGLGYGDYRGVVVLVVCFFWWMLLFYYWVLLIFDIEFLDVYILFLYGVLGEYCSDLLFVIVKNLLDLLNYVVYCCCLGVWKWFEFGVLVSLVFFV